MKSHPNLRPNPRYDFCRELMSDILEYGKMSPTPNLKKLYRKQLKQAAGEDPLRCSLCNGAVRRRYDREDGESFTEYRILKGDWTDDEIREAIDDAWITICSPYDCTGKIFTHGIHVKRTPVGLVWIHQMGLDV